MAPTKRYSGIAPQIDYMGIGRDAIVADPEDVADGSAARAVTGAYLSDRYPNLETSQYDTPEKFMSNYYESLQQKKAAADTAFNQLTLEGGKEEDKIGQYVAQAILAFTPIAAGYMLGGNESGAMGAGVGLMAQRNMISDQEAEALKEEKQTEAKKAFYAKESQEIGKEMTDFYKKQMDRKASLEDKIAYKEELKKRGLDSKGVVVNNDLGPFASAFLKATTKDAAANYSDIRNQVSNELQAASATKQAARDLLKSNPDLQNESPFRAVMRNMGQRLYPTDEKAQALFIAQQEQLLSKVNTNVKGAASDRDIEIVQQAIAQQWNLPLPQLINSLEALERISLARLDVAREEAKIMASEDPFADSPYIRSKRFEIQGMPQSEYARETAGMNTQQKAAYLQDLKNRGVRIVNGK